MFDQGGSEHKLKEFIKVSLEIQKKLQEVDYKAEVQELSINSLVRENAAKQLPGAAQQLP